VNCYLRRLSFQAGFSAPGISKRRAFLFQGKPQETAISAVPMPSVKVYTGIESMALS
jgi:hypothetical protein